MRTIVRNRRVRRGNPDTPKDLIITFKEVCLDVSTDDTYSEEDVARIKEILDTAVKNVYIDRSYVSFEGNKHQDTYILEKGWIDLCKTIIESNFCRLLNKAERELMNEAFRMLIVGYAYTVLSKFGYETEGMAFNFIEDSSFIAEYEYDRIQEWKYYPGPWQDWDYPKLGL